jgi:hypothetical protein
MSLQKNILFEDNFLGKRSFATATAEAGTGWYATIVKTSGTPTIATATGSDSGSVVFTTDSTSEVQQLSLYQGDVLCFTGNLPVDYTCNFKLSGQTSATTAYIGLAGAHNSTAASIAPFAWLKIANSTMSAETNNNSATTSVSTGMSIGTGFTQLKISFAYGLADVRFYVDGGNGQLTRVCQSTKFDMSAYTGQLQLYTRVEKTSGAAVPILTVDYVGLQSRM